MLISPFCEQGAAHNPVNQITSVMSIRISAVICTYNRAAYLRKALRSLIEQTLDPSQYEILVIDNASTDDTRSVVESERSARPELRYVHEPTVGVSRARNAGWRNARAEYVAYLDDDAIADPPWLERMLGFLESTEPRPGAVGGRIEPIWERPRPAWLSDDMARALTVVDWSDRPIALEPHQWIVAANIGFPRRILEEIGGFKVDLGRQGSRLLSNEENYMRIQIEELGHICYYHPEIVVKHHMHASRITQSWLKRRMYWQGVSDARMRRHQFHQSALVGFMKGARSFVRMALTPALVKSLVLPTNDPILFHRKCDAWYKIGHNLGRMRLA
jgi:glycosyltransferase involved in cell wall biosynthesis